MTIIQLNTKLQLELTFMQKLWTLMELTSTSLFGILLVLIRQDQLQRSAKFSFFEWNLFEWKFQDINHFSEYNAASLDNCNLLPVSRFVYYKLSIDHISKNVIDLTYFLVLIIFLISHFLISHKYFTTLFYFSFCYYFCLFFSLFLLNYSFHDIFFIFYFFPQGVLQEGFWSTAGSWLERSKFWKSCQSTYAYIHTIKRYVDFVYACVVFSASI